MSDCCFIGQCIDLEICKFIFLEFIKFNLDSILMYMSAMYCFACILFIQHIIICSVYNSVQCVHNFYNQLNS